MKLYYVEHSVVTKARFAMVAKDDNDLKAQLAVRADRLSKVKFTSEIEKESYPLNYGWDTFVDSQVWSGKL